MRRTCGPLLATACVLWSVAAHGQGWPAGRITIVTPFAAGGGADAVGRILAEKLTAEWPSASVVVENRPGSNGSIAIRAATTAAPDGRTLLLAEASHLTMRPALIKNLPYDVKKDLVPVAPVMRASFYIVVAANSPWRSVGDLLAAARQRPGEITYGSSGTGSVFHLASAQLESAAKVKMTNVPFKESAQLYANLSNGEISWAFASLATARPFVSSGRLRLLAVGDGRRSVEQPDVPTIAESGGPAGIETASWVALMAPSGTPQARIAEINRAVGKVLQNPEVKARIESLALAPDVGSPAELAARIDADYRKYADVIQRTGITAD